MKRKTGLFAMMCLVGSLQTAATGRMAVEHLPRPVRRPALRAERRAPGHGPRVRRFMDWYHGLMWEQEVAPFDPGGIWRFGSQGVAIAVFGPWYRPGLEVAQLKFRYDVAMPPKGDRHATTYYVDQFAIAATTRHPQQAWSLLKFITGREGWEVKMALSSGGRSVPPLKEFALSKSFLEYGGLHNRVFLDALAISEKPIAALPSGQGREFLDIWWQDLDPAWKQKQPLRPLLENVQRRVREKLGL